MQQQPENSGKELKVGGYTAHYTLIICSLLYLVNYMDRQIMAAVLEPMKLALGLSDTQAGSLQTIFLLGIALCSLPVSFLVDRWSRRKAISVMAILWSIGTLLTGFGRNFISLALPRALVGVGESGFSAGGTAIISASYKPESRGKVLGVFNLVIPIGAALGVVLGGYLSKNYGGWSTPFFAFAVPGIVLGILALFMRDYKTVKNLDERGHKRGLFSSAFMLFRIPTLKWLYIGYGIRNIMNFSVLAWLSAFFMRSRSIDEAKAGMLAGGVLLMAMFGAIIGGILADAWQKKNNRARMLLPVIGDSLAAIILIIALYLNMQNLGFLVILLWGAMVMLGTPALTAVTQDVVPPAVKGFSYGIALFSMYFLGGAWGPILVGTFSDVFGGGAEGLKNALYIASLSGFVASVVLWLGSRTYADDMAKVRDTTLQEEK